MAPIRMMTNEITQASTGRSMKKRTSMIVSGNAKSAIRS